MSTSRNALAPPTCRNCPSSVQFTSTSPNLFRSRGLDCDGRKLRDVAWRGRSDSLVWDVVCLLVDKGDQLGRACLPVGVHHLCW